MTETKTTKRPRRFARTPKSASAGQARTPATWLENSDANMSTPARAPTKAATVLQLLRRPEGASLDELIGVTSWLPQTTRAALTGLRKKGHTIEKTKVDGVTRYAIAAPPQW